MTRLAIMHISVGVLLLLVFGAVILFTIQPSSLIPTAFAETSPNVTVNITINEFADISINPTNYTVALNPASDSLPINFTVTNTGSSNISFFYAYADTIVVEKQNPLGRGRASLYAGTGMIFIRNDTFGGFQRAFHVGRLEWNLTANLPGENLLLGGDQNQSWGRGWYRNGSNVFLWKVENGTRANQTELPATYDPNNGACNITGTIFKIKRDPENTTSGFQRDFSLGQIDSGTMDAQTKDWGIFHMTGGALSGYCVATYHNCTKIFIYRFDRRTQADSNFNACPFATNMNNATLFPGDIQPFTLFTSAPAGVPAGQTATGRLTIAA